MKKTYAIRTKAHNSTICVGEEDTIIDKYTELTNKYGENKLYIYDNTTNKKINLDDIDTEKEKEEEEVEGLKDLTDIVFPWNNE
jgi:hypothetical protein